MANQEHLDLLKEGVEVWNAWRVENREVRVDLSEANLFDAYLVRAYLSEAILTGADLNRATLIGATLIGANLDEATFYRAKLDGASLIEANLRRVYLYEAHLSGANLSRADLTGANLTGANLTGANVEKARLFDTVFANTNLSGTKGLDTCDHQGPSTLDHRTLKNNPNLPFEFLRGCGLSDLDIEVYKLKGPGLTATQINDIGYKIIELRSDPAIQFYSCFISYSSKNKDFAQRLHDGLQNKGVRCWFAPEDLKIGDKIRHAIDDAIRLHDKLLLILSQPAIESGWVAYEADRALSRELIDKRTILFPIRLDNSVFDVDDGWALHIKEDRHIGDFTRWKDHDHYAASFQRLLRDLKA